MKKVLFVDDEPNILTGLKRMLRSMRKEWDMVTIDGGAKALEILASESDYDVIVTDMRMPEMDGVELLTKVKTLYPHIIRIILSGQSDYSASLESTSVAHQYLSKPCDAEVLKQAVEKSVALKALLNSESLVRLVSQEHVLPSPSHIYQQLMKEIESPDSSMSTIAELISQDVAMTAKILQLINSAFFGLPRNITRLAEAVSYLGINTIKGLVLMTETFGSVEKAENKVAIDRLWKHSLQVANLAKRLAKEEGMDRKLQEQAFLAGMLHDIGYLVLMSSEQEKMDSLSQGESGDSPYWQREKQMLGCTHAEIGGYLLSIWGLPNALVEVVVNHHQPARQLNEEFNLVVLVHVADALVHPDDPDHPNYVDKLLDMELLQKLGAEQKLDEWRKLAGALENE